MNTLTLLQLRSFLSQMRHHEDLQGGTCHRRQHMAVGLDSWTYPQLIPQVMMFKEEHATVAKLSALGIAMQVRWVHSLIPCTT